jgi:hypothetical protein
MGSWLGQGVLSTDKQPAGASIGNVIGWLHAKGLSTAAAGIYQLEKSGVSQEGVKSAMTACGYTNLIGTGDTTPIDQVLTHFYCMKDSGFKRTNNIPMQGSSQRRITGVRRPPVTHQQEKAGNGRSKQRTVRHPH